MGSAIGEALCLACFFGFLQIGVFIIIPTSIIWMAYWKPFWVIPALVLYATSYFDGAEKDIKRKRAWPWFSKNFGLLCYLRNYFPQRVHVPEGFPASKPTTESSNRQQYLFAVHPHGCMSEYRLLMDGQFLELLPGLGGKQVCWLAASVLFRLPFARELCLWSGCVDAGRTTAAKMLEAGHSVGVIPGGEHEQLLTTYGKEIVYVKKRLGFVKLALRFGVPLVPCYVFGVSDLYRTSSACMGIRMFLVKRLGIAIPLCFGSYGLPAAPLKKPVDIVLGMPLHFEKCPSPTDEQVEQAHAKYVDALQKLFEDNKAKFGYESRSLKLQ